MISSALQVEIRVDLPVLPTWKRVLAGSLIFILTLAGILCLHTIHDRMDRLSVRRRLQPFSVSDLDGRRIVLGNGKPGKTALLFFLPSCGHCRVELSHFDALSQFESNDLKIYAISVASLEQTREFAREQRTRNFYIAAPGTASRLGLLKVPVLVLVDRDGTISAVEEGERSPQYEKLILSRFRSNLPVDSVTMKNVSLVSTHE